MGFSKYTSPERMAIFQTNSGFSTKSESMVLTYLQCYFVTIATVLGTGVLGLPVKLSHSGLSPFLISFFIAFFMQILLVLFFTDLLQRAHSQQIQSAKDEGPENLPLNDIDLEDEIEEEHESNDAVMAGHIIIPKTVEAKPPNLHLLGELFLMNGLRQMFDLLLLVHFIALLVSYALAGSEAYASVIGVSHVYLIPAFVWILSFGVVFAFQFIQPVVSLLTFGKGSLLLATVVITMFVGASIHHDIATDFSYTGAPFLMGTVALGGVINIMPLLYKKIKPIENQVRGYRASIICGLTTCTLLNILWCWSILDIVPQTNKCFMYEPLHNNSYHTVGNGSSRLVCSQNISLESAEANGEISTIPLTQIIHHLYPNFDWVALLIELFIMLSITVSFLTMGAALQHTLSGWIESFFEQDKFALYTSKFDRSSNSSFLHCCSCEKVCSITLSLFAFSMVFIISMVNPKGFIMVLEKAASLLMNTEAGFFVFIMILKSSRGQNSQLQIPLPLPWYIRHLQYLLPIYFGFAVIYDIFVTIYGIFNVNKNLPWETASRPAAIFVPNVSMLSSISSVDRFTTSPATVISQNFTI